MGTIETIMDGKRTQILFRCDCGRDHQAELGPVDTEGLAWAFLLASFAARGEGDPFRQEIGELTVYASPSSDRVFLDIDGATVEFSGSEACEQAESMGIRRKPLH